MKTLDLRENPSIQNNDLLNVRKIDESALSKYGGVKTPASIMSSLSKNIKNNTMGF